MINCLLVQPCSQYIYQCSVDSNTMANNKPSYLDLYRFSIFFFFFFFLNDTPSKMDYPNSEIRLQKRNGERANNMSNKINYRIFTFSVYLQEKIEKQNLL